MMEDEPLSLKEKVFRTVFGIFLFILVSMLVLTLLPGDAEKGIIQLITGGNSSSAGTVGSMDIPIGYFQRARSECYYRYKQYLPNMKDNQSIIDSCAYSTVKRLKVAGIIARASGYDISQNYILRELSDEARTLHKQSDISAGYSKEEIRSVEDIYRDLLRRENLPYRKDTTVAYKLMDGFLLSKTKKTDSQTQIEKEASGVKLTLNYVVFSDDDIFNQLDKEITISEEEVKKEYESESKSGKLPKDKDGKPETYEKRKIFLESKLKSEIKRQKLTELKTKLDGLKSKGETALAEIAKSVGKEIKSVKSISLSEMDNMKNAENKEVSFLSNSNFLKELADIEFGKNKVGGPYKDIDKSIYVEFKAMEITTVTDSQPAAVDNSSTFS